MSACQIHNQLAIVFLICCEINDIVLVILLSNVCGGVVAQ